MKRITPTGLERLLDRAAQTAIKRPEDGLLAKCFNKAPMQWRLPRPANGVAATVTIRLVAKLR